MAVPPGAERPGEAGGRPYGEKPKVERRERLVAVAERRERRRRLLHLLLAQAKSGTKPLSPCCSLVTDGRVRVDAGARDHGGGSDDSAYKEAGRQFLFYPMCACARARWLCWVWHPWRWEFVSCAPFFLTRSGVGSVGVVRVGCLLEGKMLEATALPLESEFF